MQRSCTRVIEQLADVAAGMQRRAHVSRRRWPAKT
jgi:hypothetical protein